jgi:uncharacterized protein YjeT (DUF2065 family)
MWVEILTALSLVLVFEGLLPFISPSAWKSAMLVMLRQDEQSLRWAGLSAMIAGVVLLTLVR